MNTTQETEFDYQKHLKESARGPSEINRGTKAREKRREAAKARISQNGQFRRVLEKIQEIAEKSTDGDYIYRGEPEHYEKVSSSLYRKYPESETEYFDIEVVQEEMIEAAKGYTSETNDFEILTELQHYGGTTNLIDFTSDYLIALFFACGGSGFLEKDGRVIFVKKTKKVNEWIKSPQNPRNRVIAQKSVFVRPPNGFIEPDHVIKVPKDLKQSVLGYLRKCHGISIETIYNDLHGFIRYQNDDQRAHEELYIGRTDQSEKRYRQAIEHYTKAIELNPQMARAYYNRGNANSDLKDYEEALKDYSKAIQLDPEYSDSFFNRANANADLCRFQEAVADYDEAIRLGSENALFNKGNVLVLLGRFDEALQCYRESPLNRMDNAGALENRRAVEKVIDIIGNQDYTIKKSKLDVIDSMEYTTKKSKEPRCVLVLSVLIAGYEEKKEYISFQGRVGNTGNFPSGEGFSGGDGFVVIVEPKNM
ncbi:MAG: tetratricopeptide repeat protein [Gemmatimonadetes bacterium]|nr:tetratricopeptide repeat protein [Gemmatimonadota bacterium]